MIKIKKISCFEDGYYDFNEWEQAFQYYDAVVSIHGPEAVQFVCYEHPHTSGYWIEEAGCELSNGDTLVPAEQIKGFAERIRTEIELAKKEGRSPQFIRP